MSRTPSSGPSGPGAIRWKATVLGVVEQPLNRRQLRAGNLLAEYLLPGGVAHRYTGLTAERRGGIHSCGAQ